jgi:hypothetical protein
LLISEECDLKLLGWSWSTLGRWFVLKAMSGLPSPTRNFFLLQVNIRIGLILASAVSAVVFVLLIFIVLAELLMEILVLLVLLPL